MLPWCGMREVYLCSSVAGSKSVFYALATTGSSTVPVIILYDVRNIFCPSGFISQTLPAFVFVPYFPLFRPCALPCSIVVVAFLILHV
jgi:hypothetical protein